MWTLGSKGFPHYLLNSQQRNTTFDRHSSQDPNSTTKASLRVEVWPQLKYQFTIACESNVGSYHSTPLDKPDVHGRLTLWVAFTPDSSRHQVALFPLDGFTPDLIKHQVALSQVALSRNAPASQWKHQHYSTSSNGETDPKRLASWVEESFEIIDHTLPIRLHDTELITQGIAAEHRVVNFRICSLSLNNVKEISSI